jgi:hypothetical protein
LLAASSGVVSVAAPYGKTTASLLDGAATGFLRASWSA